MAKGNYLLDVKVGGTAVFGSPFAVQVTYGALNLDRTSRKIAVAKTFNAGQEVAVIVAPCDRFGNNVPTVSCRGAEHCATTFDQAGDGAISSCPVDCTYTENVPGTFSFALGDENRETVMVTDPVIQEDSDPDSAFVGQMVGRFNREPNEAGDFEVQTAGEYTLAVSYTVFAERCAPTNSATECSLGQGACTVNSGDGACTYVPPVHRDLTADAGIAVVVTPAELSPQDCELAPATLMSTAATIYAGETATASLRGYDVFGNAIAVGGAVVSASAESVESGVATVADLAGEPGTYAISFYSEKASDETGHTISVTVDAQPASFVLNDVTTQSYRVVVLPGSLATTSEYALGTLDADVLSASITAGEPEQFKVLALDMYGNLEPTVGDSRRPVAATDFNIVVRTATATTYEDQAWSVDGEVVAGAFHVVFEPQQVGSYEVIVTLASGGEAIRGPAAGATVNVEAAVALSPDTCVVEWSSGGPTGLVGKASKIYVYLRDAFGNPQHSAVLENGSGASGAVTAAVLSFAPSDGVELTPDVQGEDDPRGYKFTLEYRVGAETGSCSNGAYEDSSTCESSGAVWTWAPTTSEGGLAGDYAVTISMTHNGDSYTVREYTGVRIGSGLGAISAENTQCARCSSAEDTVIAGVESTFDLEVRDEDGTLVPAGVKDANDKDSVVFSVTSGGATPTVQVVGSVYRVTFTARSAGTLLFDVLQDSVPLTHLQPSVTVVPADPAVQQTALDLGIPDMTAGVPGSFSVVLKDQFDNEISSVDAATDLVVDVATGGNAVESARAGCLFQGSPMRFQCIVYTEIADEFSLSVSLSIAGATAVPIPGSPFELVVSPAPLNADRTTVEGSGLRNAVAGVPAQVIITAYDEFGNRLQAGGDSSLLELHLTQSGLACCTSEYTSETETIVDNQDGTYTASYVVTQVVGDPYILTAVVGGTEKASVRGISVKPNVPHSEMSIITGATAGRTVTLLQDNGARFTIDMVDRWGNAVTNPDQIKAVALAITHGVQDSAATHGGIVRSVTGNRLTVSYKVTVSGPWNIVATFADAAAPVRTATWAKAVAPEIMQVSVRGTGQGLRAVFNKETDRGGKAYRQFACSDLVAAATTALLGTGAQCQWRDARTLNVDWGSGTRAAKVYDAFELMAGSQVGRKGLDSYYATLGSPILPPPPEEVEPPEVNVRFQTTLGPCEDMIIDASGSKDTALGAPDTSEFSFVVDSEDGLRIDPSALIIDAQGSKATIPADVLMAGKLYVFNVVLRNSYGQEAVFEGSFYKEGQPIPGLDIAFSKELDYTKAAYLRGQVKLSTCASTELCAATEAGTDDDACAAVPIDGPDGSADQDACEAAGACTYTAEALPPPLSYEWTCSSCPAGTELNEKTKNSPTLYVDADSLSPMSASFTGQYTMTLTISDPADPLMPDVSKDVTFQVLSSPVQAFIAGGDTVASRAVEFVLDASATYDPDDDKCGDSCSQFVYEWSCQTNEDPPTSCYDDDEAGYGAGVTIGTSVVATIPAEQLKLAPSADNNQLRLIFTLRVVKDPTLRYPSTTGYASAQAEITIVSGQVPKCEIAPRDSIALPQDALVLMGSSLQTPDAGVLTYRWYEQEFETTGVGLDIGTLADLPLGFETEGDGIAGALSAPVKIGAYQLVEGSEYTFVLHVTETTSFGTSECVTSKSIYINDAPSGGTAVVTPSSGVMMAQEYEAAFAGWLDAQQPLSYSVSLLGEACVAADTAVCGDVVLDGTATVCESAGSCTYTADNDQTEPNEEACVATAFATCADVENDGTEATCTDAGDCVYHPISYPIATPSTFNVRKFKLPRVGMLTLILEVMDSYGSGVHESVSIESLPGEYTDATAASDLAKAQAEGNTQAIVTTASAKSNPAEEAEGRRLQFARRLAESTCIICDITSALAEALASSVLAESDVAQFLSTLQGLAETPEASLPANTAMNTDPPSTLDQMLSTFEAVVIAGRDLGMTEEIALQALQVAAAFSAEAVTATCSDSDSDAGSSKTNSREIFASKLRLEDIAHGLLSNMLVNEEPKALEVGSGETRLAVVVQRYETSASGSYTSAGSSPITLGISGIADGAVGGTVDTTTTYFDVVHATQGSAAFCNVDGTSLLSSVERYSFYGSETCTATVAGADDDECAAVVNDGTATTCTSAGACTYTPAYSPLQISTAITVDMSLYTELPSGYVVQCMRWDHNQDSWTCDPSNGVCAIETQSVSGTTVTCGLGALYADQILGVVATPWTECDPEDQYESQAPSATSDRVCLSHPVCENNQYESKAPTTTSPRECADVTACSADSGLAVSQASTTTSDNVCECDVGYFTAPAPTGCTFAAADTDLNTPETCADATTECTYTVGSQLSCEHEVITECTAWTDLSNDATVVENEPGTASSDRTYTCKDGFWKANGGIDGSCAAWSTCDPDAVVTEEGTQTSDRQCACSVAACSNPTCEFTPGSEASCTDTTGCAYSAPVAEVAEACVASAATACAAVSLVDTCTGQRDTDDTDCASYAAFVSAPVEANCPTSDGCTFTAVGETACTGAGGCEYTPDDGDTGDVNEETCVAAAEAVCSGVTNDGNAQTCTDAGACTYTAAQSEQVEACTATSCSYGDGFTCVEHPTCDSEQQYETRPATSTLPRQCAYLRVCQKSARQYESVAPTATSNRECAPLTECTANQYISTDAEEFNNQFVTDQTCTDITVCTPGEQFESVAPDVRRDRECVALSACHANAIEFKPPTETTDRQCRCNAGFYDPAGAEAAGTECVEEIPCAAEACVPTVPGTDDEVCANADLANLDLVASEQACAAAGQCTYTAGIELEPSTDDVTCAAAAAAACTSVSLDGDALANENACETAGACAYTPDDPNTLADEEACAATAEEACANVDVAGNFADGSAACAAAADGACTYTATSNRRGNHACGCHEPAEGFVIGPAVDTNACSAAVRPCAYRACTGADVCGQANLEGTPGLSVAAALTQARTECLAVAGGESCTADVDCSFTPNDASSCTGTPGCEYTAASDTVQEACTPTACSFTLGDASSCTGQTGEAYSCAYRASDCTLEDEVEYEAEAAANGRPHQCAAMAESCADDQYENNPSAKWAPQTQKFIADRDCITCTRIENAVPERQIECSSSLTSRFTDTSPGQCLSGFGFYGDGPADMCTACHTMEPAGAADDPAPTVASCTACVGSNPDDSATVEQCTAAVCAADSLPGSYGCTYEQYLAGDACATDAQSIQECIPCTGVEHGVGQSCTTLLNTRVESCEVGYYRVAAVANDEHDQCVACQPVPGAVQDGAVSCTNAIDTRIEGCASNHYYHLSNAGDPSAGDQCMPCTTVEGSVEAICGAVILDGTEATCTNAGSCIYTESSGDTAEACNAAAPATCSTASDTRVSGCASGFYYTDNSGTPDVADTCTACTRLDERHVAEGAVYTCTSASDSRVSECDEGRFKVSTGEADRCVPCANMLRIDSVAPYSCAACTGGEIDECTAAECKPGYYGYAGGECQECAGLAGIAQDATYSCTDATDTQISTCMDGYWLQESTADVCNPCTPVQNAAADATYLCTTAADSRVSACATGMSLVPGEDGAADTCETSLAECDAVEGAAADATITCTAPALPRVSACAAGYHRVKGGSSTPDRCVACEPVPHAAVDATITCTSAADSRVSSCGADHYKVAGSTGVPDACVAVSVCPANAKVAVPAAAASDVVCTCRRGFWASDGGVEQNCVAWTPCAAGLSVSTDGSTTKDQVCGLKIRSALAVPGAVTDIGSFRDAIKAAAQLNSGGDSVDVEITSFVQTIASTASFPGTASDYQTDAAQDQFKAGVRVAAGGGEVTNVCIDGQSCSNNICEACSGRRRLNSRRRLQAVDITYDVVVNDPQIAGAVAAATSDTASFATGLATAINDAGDGVGALQLAPDDIAVSAPSVSTQVQYDVVVQTTNTANVQAVSAGLTNPTELAAALQSSVDTGGAALVIDSNSLQAEVVCSRPSSAGYSYVETDLSADPAEFDVTATCAVGYETSGSGGPTVTVCSQGSDPFVLGGDTCEPIVCERPAGVGYAFVENNLDLGAGEFDVVVSCAAPSAAYPGGFTGTAAATECTTSGEYTVTGVCEEAPVQCATTSQTGYVVSENSLAPGSDGSEWDVTATCDTEAGYEGTAVASPCELSGDNYVLSGCALPTPPTPPEEEGGGAGVVIGIILGIVAVAVIGVFGVKAMKSKGGNETTGARPSMLSPSAAAYQTDDVDPEAATTRSGRKLSF
jgi:hypothetical protein